MATLHLTLKRRWFIDILRGIKKEEYREIKPFWTQRLHEQFETVTFRNGYRNGSPVMVLEFRGLEVKEIVHPVSGELVTVYAIKLGALLTTSDCDGLKEGTGAQARTVPHADAGGDGGAVQHGAEGPDGAG